MKKLVSVVSTVLLVAAFFTSNLVGTAAAAAQPCVDPSPKVEWPGFGRDLTNSRHQDTSSINASNVSSLKPAWALSSSNSNGIGSFQSTPIVGGGCVFAATTNGSLFAADADTGKVIWHTFHVAGPHGGIGGIFAPAYNDGVVYALVQRPTVFSVVALDAATGEEIWNTVIYQDLAENAELHALANNSSVVFYEGLLFLGTSGTDSFNFSHPSFFILEAESGAILKKTTVIPQEKWLDGYAGGGIWATAAVDKRTGYLYVGTANPYNKRREYKYTNAIIKVDLNRDSKTFGEIVDGYRGDIDYDPDLYDTPQCKYLGETQPIWFSYFCGQKDIDFGASPSLYTDSNGDTIVAELQKSCTMHAVRTDTMKRLWKHKKLAVGGLSGCAGGSAYDNHALYVAVNEGVMYALDKDTGDTLWKTKYRDSGSNYHPVSLADGLVFTIGNNGNLYALDNQTGKILFEEQLSADGITCTATQSTGVSIVGDTVFVGCDSAEGASATSAVFAYRLK